MSDLAAHGGRPGGPGPWGILVIEDDPDTRANMRAILELDDYRVAEAATAAEGLKQAAGGDWLAIILDGRLPDGEAASVLPRLRRAAPDAAIVIVTGYADLQGAISALRDGAADYILKPLSPEALRASLGRVAERRRLALERDQSEAVFRHLVEAAECAIVILRHDRSILYFSPFAERLAGRSADSVRGEDAGSLIRLGPELEGLDGVLARLRDGEALPALEGQLLTREAGPRWMIWNVRGLGEYEGAPAVIAVGQDVTGLKLAQERALQAERLAAIGQMVTGLAHESRNALQRSQACLEMLALEVADRPAALDLIGRIQAAQDHLAHLYEDVRGYATPLRLQREWAELAAIWRAEWGRLHHRGSGRASLVEHIGPAGTGCSVDAFRMGQVFRNVLENALFAGGAEPVVTIHCEEGTLEGRPALCVAVRDNGPGIDPSTRERIFEPFFTTKLKGTGLGLAIARRVVEAHGGRIAAGAPEGPGAEILLTIPRGQRA